MNADAPTDAPADPVNAAHRLRRLLDIGAALGAPRPLGELLPLLLKSTTELLGCERASILIYDAERRGLRFAAATGSRAESLAHIHVPMEGSLAGTAFTRDVPVLADAERDPRHFQSAADATGFKPRAILSVPMRFGGRPTGVLQALNPASGVFTADDADVLMAVAPQAAAAIRSAQQRRALQEANALLARQDKLRSDFMTVASHEMRTPLAGLIGFAQILREEADASLAAHADEVLASAHRLQKIVETLEELGDLGEAGADDRRQRNVLQDVLRESTAVPESDGPVLRYELPFEPLVVGGDPERLRRAFGHVIENALRFTPPEGLVIVRAAAQGDEAHVTVTDTGRGLAPDQVNVIFGAFKQADDVLTREHEGLGVGLAIARAVLERSGGRIWAESLGLGRGSTFHVRLPLLQGDGV